MLPFNELQRKANARYYKKKGSAIYEDFSTFAKSGTLSRANSLEFHAHISALERAEGEQSELRICEFGIGDGSFCKSFLSELSKLDKKHKTDYSKRVHYSLFDISPKMLASAKKTLSSFSNLEFIEADACEPIPYFKKAHYVRMNELYTDLPTRILARKGESLCEVLYEMHGNQLQTSLKPISKLGEEEKLALLFLQRLPELYFIPFNNSAAAHVLQLAKICSSKLNSYADIFDYGFISAEEILEMPREMWNSSIVREYGTQLTTDLNFPYLASFARAGSFEVEFETQRAYVERILGKKLQASEKKNALAYTKKTRAFEESDDFVHMRLSAPKAK
ncbi:MAG: SAM-dependent methyltransferase [Candidatus Micrarchaeota archaeon]